MGFACNYHLIRVIRKTWFIGLAAVTVMPARHGTDWRCDDCGKKAAWAVNKI